MQQNRHFSLFFIFLILIIPRLSYSEEKAPVVKSFSTEAEIFGLKVNNLSKKRFEKQLAKMGLEPYPSYQQGVASYKLGANGILGIESLEVIFNSSNFIREAKMSGVVKDNKQRSTIGTLLEKKYGPPPIGFVMNGFGRAKWLFKDGTYIELHNTTLNVSILYVDQQPKVLSSSGSIDVEALARKLKK